MRIILCLLLAIVLSGCGQGQGTGEPQSQAIPIDRVPPELVKIAQEKLPGIKFDHAHRKPNGDWEIRGKGPNGKVREVELTSSGELVEIE
jgi:hypothetical protein